MTDVPKEVNLVLMCGWLCNVDDYQFIVGPFVDRAESVVWLEGIKNSLSQDLEVIDDVVMVYPASFTEVQAVLRAGTGRVGRLHGPK